MLTEAPQLVCSGGQLDIHLRLVGLRVLLNVSSSVHALKKIPAKTRYPVWLILSYKRNLGRRSASNG